MCARKFISFSTLHRGFCSVMPEVGQVSTGLPTSRVLEDAHGRHHSYLRISLTERCNLRCTYCMPEEGIQLTNKSHLLSTDEMLYLTRLFVQHGVTKIRLTGGEPTVRKDLGNIIEQLREFSTLKTIAMTTNGLTLTRQLKDLQKAGLNAVNISLDTLRDDRFSQITRRGGWSRVMAGIDHALHLGYDPVKVNCVVVRGFNDDEILDFVEFTKDRNVHVRFIEYMPFGGNKWNTRKLIPSGELVRMIKQRYPDFQKLPSTFNETSKLHKVPGHVGKIGFISSITDNFCGSCNRVRLLADGSLKVCLLGSVEVSLRDALRSGSSEDDILALIQASLMRKKKQHAVGTVANTVNTIRTPYSFHGLKMGNSVFSSYIKERCICRRHFSSSDNATGNRLTHVTSDGGEANMVDVSNKVKSVRFASAYGEVYVGPRILRLIIENQMKKGDVLSVAKLAGIMGAKRTPELVPLCHSISLTYSNVELRVDEASECVTIVSEVRCVGETGVEMEALTAVSVAALTVYDMCKAVGHGMVIRNVRLLAKTGGKSDYKYKES